MLTYHEILLLTLDWNSDKAHQVPASRRDLWPRTDTALRAARVDDVPPATDAWKTFLNGTDGMAGQEASVSDAWQTFLTGTGCTELSAVPESEWLQRATSVSPSKDKKSLAKTTTDSQGHELRPVGDAPAVSHAETAACVSEPCEGVTAKVSTNPSARHLANAPREQSVTGLDAPYRPGMNPPAGIPEKFNETSEKHSVERSTERPECATGEQEEQGMRRVERKKDERLTPPTVDPVTSSGEPETTALTSLSETQNDSAVDRISHGARAGGEGLSFSGEGQVAGAAHNVTDDTLAFTGTIVGRTEAEGLFVFSTSAQGVEKGGVDRGGKSTGEEIFMPREKEECEISQRFERDETQHEQLRPRQSGGNPAEGNEGDGNEAGRAQSNADESGLNKTCRENFEQVKTEGTQFKSDIENAGSVELASDGTGGAEFSKSTSQGGLIGAKEEAIQEFNEGKEQNSVNSFQPPQPGENTSKLYEACNQQLTQIRSREELQIHDDREALEATPRREGTWLECEAGKGGFVFDETEEGKCLISHTRGSREMQEEVSRGDNDAFRPSPSSQCHPLPKIAGESGWVHTQDNMKAEKGDMGRQISPQEVAEEIDTSGELQRRPETPTRTEGDKSHGGNNEKPSEGEPKIEALGDLMGDTGIPRGEGESVPTQFKEQEQAAGVKSSPHVEAEKLSAGTKDPIMAASAVALEVTEPTLAEMYVQRFGEDLVRAIWEEVFNLKARATHPDLKAVDETAGLLAAAPDTARDCHSFKSFEDTFDSGVYSLIELPLESSLELASVAQSDGWLTKDRSQALDPEEQRHLPTKSEMNLNSSVQFDVVSGPISPANGGLSSSRVARGSLSDLESHAQIRERSVGRQETGRQRQECVAAAEEKSRKGSDCSSCIKPSASPEKLKEPGDLMWSSIFYIISHITRLLVCFFLVAGFYVVLFLCDSTAFFALYMFSLCWWFYKLKGHQVKTAKGMDG